MTSYGLCIFQIKPSFIHMVQNSVPFFKMVALLKYAALGWPQMQN